jgi:phosphoesterase RecJ-like protein
MTKYAQELKVLLSSPKKIVITTHKSPDGDAIGSSLGLLHLLKQLGHKVQIITPNSYAKFLHWLPGNDDVITYDGNEIEANKLTSEAELIFLLDFSHLSRIATYADAIKNSNATKVMIDHHQDPDRDIADIIFSNTSACSTAQMVFEVIEDMDMTSYLNKAIAECLYVGIMTDTGSFKYASTTAKTHHVIAELITAGAENAKIHDLIYDNSSATRIKLLGYCLNEKLRLYPENNAAIISLTDQELKRFEFKKGDTEGFVNYALAIEGIKFATFIAEKDGMVKLSLRSKGNFKVNGIANKYFSGGGHMNASGGISELSVNETITKVETIINEYKSELNKTN